MNENYSVLQLHEWLLEAAETERRLPRAMRRQSTNSWPDVLHEWSLDYAQPMPLGLATASSVQVDRYDRVLGWVLMLPDDSDRNLLWAAAHSAAFRSRGPKWAQIARVMHINRATVKRRYEAALLRLWVLLISK